MAVVIRVLEVALEFVVLAVSLAIATFAPDAKVAAATR
jgi:hypothetical protein